jgi:uncharacterized protein YsxB (DUF464 family)
MFAPLVCDYNEDGGYMRFGLTGNVCRDAKLLLDAMMLGLNSVKENYPHEIEITERK